MSRTILVNRPLDDVFTPVASGIERIDLPEDGVTIWRYPHVTCSCDHRPNHRDATVRRLAAKRYKSREAQRTYAKHLTDLVHDVRRNPDTVIPAALANDVAEVLEAIAIDLARKEQVRAIVRATCGERTS